MKNEMIDAEKIGTFLHKICVSKGALYDTLISAMNNPAKIEKVALYARVSTKDGRQDTENQLIALRDYCAKQGWTIAAEYVDHESKCLRTRGRGNSTWFCFGRSIAFRAKV
jgi:predicted site-specific integrase-resolvase